MPSFTRESGGTLHVAVMGVNRIGKIYSWAYIIIPIFSLPWHIYFSKNGKVTLGNYMFLWSSISITTVFIYIAWDYSQCYRGFVCSNTTVSDFIPELRLVLIGCLGGLIFWFIACWRHDFNASDRTLDAPLLHSSRRARPSLSARSPPAEFRLAGLWTSAAVVDHLSKPGR